MQIEQCWKEFLRLLLFGMCPLLVKHVCTFFSFRDPCCSQEMWYFGLSRNRNIFSQVLWKHLGTFPNLNLMGKSSVFTTAALQMGTALSPGTFQVCATLLFSPILPSQVISIKAETGCWPALASWTLLSLSSYCLGSWKICTDLIFVTPLWAIGDEVLYYWRRLKKLQIMRTMDWTLFCHKLSQTNWFKVNFLCQKKPPI